MKAFYRLPPSRHMIERGVELRQAAHLDHQMKLAKRRRSEPELLPGHAKSLDQALLFQMPQITGELFGERQIAHPRLQVTPHVINVHRGLACDPALRLSDSRRCASGTPDAGTAGHTTPAARAVQAVVNP